MPRTHMRPTRIKFLPTLFLAGSKLSPSCVPTKSGAMECTGVATGISIECIGITISMPTERTGSGTVFLTNCYGNTENARTTRRPVAPSAVMPPPAGSHPATYERGNAFPPMATSRPMTPHARRTHVSLV